MTEGCYNHPMNQIEFSPTLFFQYAKSPHWIWYDHFGDQAKKGEEPAMAKRFQDEGLLHEKNYIKDIEFEEIKTEDEEEAVQKTMELMKTGAQRIYQGYLRTEKDNVIYKGRPDFLEKQKGKSAFGDYYYIPVDIKNTSAESGEETKLQYRLQLTMYAWMLKEIQQFYPDQMIIINRDFKRIKLETDADLSIIMWDYVKKILKILEKNEPPLKISSSSKDTPWFDLLLSEAEKKDDIALLYNVNEIALHDLREHNIKTVHDAAKIEPYDLPYIRGISEEHLERVQMQAEALVENKVIWRKPIDIPEGEMKIYFDIEGDPFLKIDYLYGFWIANDPASAKASADITPEPYFKYFLAEKPEEEGQMWKEFLKWVEGIHQQNYKVYHYSPYEMSSIKKLTNRYGGSSALDEFKNHFVDLAKAVKKSVIFPLYFYSIKDIAKSNFLGYKWRHKEASGAQSIFWYEKWLETGDKKVLQNIIDYNEDDVIATQVLHEWLKANSPEK